jgi:hypothetical protein
MSLTDRRLLYAALVCVFLGTPFVLGASGVWLFGYNCGYIVGLLMLWVRWRILRE